MSIPPTKYILTATLGRFGPSLPPDLQTSLATSLSHAAAAGYEISNIELDPLNPDGSLARLRERIGERRWDGLLIGFAVRGSKEYTPMFEGAVNLAREMAPRMRLLFGVSPGDLMGTLERGFGMEG